MAEDVMVFVDAGYIYGVMKDVYSVERIDDLTVSYAPLAELLRQRIEDAVGPVLRIRWYDATDPARRITNPRAIGMAGVPGVRLVEGRLLNRNGALQQKAVDTRLVADMVTIAHQRQVDRFVLISGDEDMLPGVEAAEDLGLHVEVWSIEASDGAPNVSRELALLADTHRTVSADDLKKVVAPVRTIVERIAAATAASTRESAPSAPETRAQVESTATLHVPAPVPKPPTRPVPVPPPQPSTTRVSPPVSPSDSSMELAELPNLWGIDQAAYHRPIEGELPDDATEQQRATLVGAIYARRWWGAAGEEAREQVGALCPGVGQFVRVPPEIDKDLLRFAEDHGLDTWTHEWVKTRVRNGWWDEIDEVAPVSA